jgi:hypothetical protein
MNRLGKFVVKNHGKGEKDWKYIEIPIHCFGKFDNLTQNICKICEKKYCKEFKELPLIKK